MIKTKGYDMTKFDNALFSYHGGYLTYGSDRRFVARFKHKSPFTKAVFLKELIRNHTVEGYFTKLEVNDKAPLTILADANPDWFYGILNAWAEKNGSAARFGKAA